MIPMFLAQAAVQSIAEGAVGQGRSGVQIFLDAGIIGLIVTNGGLLIKAAIDRKAIKAALSVAEKACLAKEAEDEVSRLKPGEAHTCRVHGESIATLIESKVNTEKLLDKIDKKTDALDKKTDELINKLIRVA